MKSGHIYLIIYSLPHLKAAGKPSSLDLGFDFKNTIQSSQPRLRGQVISKESDSLRPTRLETKKIPKKKVLKIAKELSLTKPLEFDVLSLFISPRC